MNDGSVASGEIKVGGRRQGTSYRKVNNVWIDTNIIDVDERFIKDLGISGKYVNLVTPGVRVADHSYEFALASAVRGSRPGIYSGVYNAETQDFSSPGLVQEKLEVFPTMLLPD